VPTYQYRCTACGEDVEAVQSFSDNALTECPACGGPLRKVFSAVGVVFKGSGFYKTDSRSGGKTTTKERTKETVGASESSGGSSSSSSSSDSSAGTGSSSSGGSSSDSGSSSNGGSSNSSASTSGSSSTSSSGSAASAA
jgi:putative FmdB family regulatory protein